jgi:hypothetical protein
MKGSGKLLVLLCSAALFMPGCATSPVPEAPAPVQTPAVSHEEAPEPVPDVDAQKPSAEKPAEFVVTEDLYRKTFGEIEQLVNTLDRSIKEKNFDEWVSYLSPEYAAHAGNAEFLREASQSAVLKRHGITLRSLKDYFLYVVVPSRSQATLDDISFVDETHVKAIALVNEKPVILYWLVRSDARWKIGIW